MEEWGRVKRRSWAIAGIVSWNFVLEREKPDDDYGWMVRMGNMGRNPDGPSAISWVIGYLDPSQ